MLRHGADCCHSGRIAGCPDQAGWLGEPGPDRNIIGRLRVQPCEIGFAQNRIFGGQSFMGEREDIGWNQPVRSEEHTSELQSLMRISYAVFCLKKKNKS